MTDIDLDKLEAVAEAATPGPWFRGHNENGAPQGEMSVWPDAKMHGGLIAACGHQMPWEGWFEQPAKDAAFIAAANPATIKSLIASAREAAAEIERLREAMTASGATKAAYHGEFKFTQVGRDEDGDEYTYETYVPWTTVKEIMAAIRARAAHTGER